MAVIGYRCYDHQMSENVASWQMRGRIFVWRYKSIRTIHQGWHFSAEPLGCDALIELLILMKSTAAAAHRTIAVAQPTPSIWSLPDYGEPKQERLGKMRVLFDPLFDDLQMQLNVDRLELRTGVERIDDLIVALTDVRSGKGDFAFGPTHRGASPPLCFWAMRR